MEVPGDPYLRCGEPVVLEGIVEVDVADIAEKWFAVIGSPLNPVPVTQQNVDLLARSGSIHCRSVRGDRQQRLLDQIVWDRRIQEVKGITQTVGEDGLVDRVPTEGASRSERLGVGVDDGPSQLGEQIE